MVDIFTTPITPDIDISTTNIQTDSAGNFASSTSTTTSAIVNANGDSGVIYYVTSFRNIAIAVTSDECNRIVTSTDSYWLKFECIDQDTASISLWFDWLCREAQSSSFNITTSDLGNNKGSGVIGDFNCNPTANRQFTTWEIDCFNDPTGDHNLFLAIGVCIQSVFSVIENSTLNSYSLACRNTHDGVFSFVDGYKGDTCGNINNATSNEFWDVCQWWEMGQTSIQVKFYFLVICMHCCLVVIVFIIIYLLFFCFLFVS